MRLQDRPFRVDLPGLVDEITRDRVSQALVGDPMVGIGRHRQVAARQLVRALGAGLDALQAARDRVVDGAVVAGLEMQEAVLLDTAPVAPVERVRAGEVERRGHRPSGPLDHDQNHRIAHPLAEQAEERAREIGDAPFPAAGLPVEGEEGVPMALRDVGARQGLDGEPGLGDDAALLADLLALARRQAVEEIVETAVTLVAPVELHPRAPQEPGVAHQVELGLGGEGDVQRGGAGPPAERDAGAEQSRPHGAGLRAFRRQQARPRHRREGNGNLELRVVAAAGPLERLGPAVIEDVFAVGMALEIHRRGAENGAGAVLEDDVPGEPAGFRRARAALLQGREKGVADERVGGAGAAVPVGGRHRADRGKDVGLEGGARLPARFHVQAIFRPEAARSRRSVLRWISAGPPASSACARAGAKASVLSTVQALAPQARAAAAKSGLSSATP